MTALDQFAPTLKYTLPKRSRPHMTHTRHYRRLADVLMLCRIYPKNSVRVTARENPPTGHARLNNILLTKGGTMKAKQKTSLSILLGAIFLLAVSVSSARADTLLSVNQGTYDNNGVQYTPTIFVGFAGTLELHNFLVFDLSSLAGQTVTGGELVIFPNNGGYTSSESEELFQAFGYTGSIANLAAGTGGTAAFKDLVSGDLYGDGLVRDGSGGSNSISGVIVQLNSNALADINALLIGSGFDFVIGGLCSTCSSSPSQNLWAPSAIAPAFAPAAQLSLEVAPAATVPLPAALPLFAGGLGLLGWLARRRRKVQTAAQAAFHFGCRRFGSLVFLA
jgi:hypothetical protein